MGNILPARGTPEMAAETRVAAPKESRMKHALIGLLILGGCGTPELSDFGTADEHMYNGKSWYMADRKGQLAVALMSGGDVELGSEYRAAARDYLLQRQRTCSVSTGKPGGENRYVFDYSCR